MKKVISILLALLSIMVFAIPAFAAAPLGRSDFNTVTQVDGTSNFMDYVKQKDSISSYYTYIDTTANTAEENRGIKIGSSQSQVYAQFGKASTSKVDLYDHINSGYTSVRDVYNKFDVPTTKSDYSYHKTGRDYHKTFYFDEENKVCLIVWWVS